jgi:hypothetical protein
MSPSKTKSHNDQLTSKMKNRPKEGEGDGHTMPTAALQKVAEEKVACEVETAWGKTSIVRGDSTDEDSSSSSISRAEINTSSVPADSEAGGHKVKNLIEIPTSLDILCGRGKPIQSHTGNQWMHQIVDSYRGRYLNAPRKKKPSIVEEALNTILSNGGRFLRRIEGEDELCGWEQVTHSAVVREKLSHALRCSLKARQKEESSYDPTKRHSQEVAEHSWTTPIRHHSTAFSSYIPPSFPQFCTAAQMHSTVLSTTGNLLLPPSNAARILSSSLSAAMMTPELTSPGLSPYQADILLAGFPRSYAAAAAAADILAIENVARAQILEEYILKRRRQE